MLDFLRDFLQSQFMLSPETQEKLFTSLLILLLVLLVRWSGFRAVNQRFEEDTRSLYNWRKAVDYTSFVVGAILIGRVWLAGLQSMMTYLGILSAGLAIALQDLVSNLAGWAFIVTRRPFTVGDRLQVGEFAGDVIDIRLFEFSLLEIGNRIDAEQSTGRILHVPNGRVFSEILANYSQGLPFIWNEIPIMVTFESDWEKAKAILTEIMQTHTPPVDRHQLKQRQIKGMRFVISYNHINPTLYTEIAHSGVRLTIRYLVQPRQKRDSEQILYEAILRAFALHDDIDIAYETQREYIHYMEKKRPSTEPPIAKFGREPEGEE